MSDTFLSNNRIGIASSSGGVSLIDKSGNNSGVVIDTAGWSGVVFLVTVHNQSATASINFKVQGGDTSASAAAGTGCDLTGTAVNMSGDYAQASGQLVAIEVVAPVKRFIRLYATRDTSGSQFSSTYILYGPVSPILQPWSNAATTAGFGITDASGSTVKVEQHVSPALGTA